MHQNNEHSRCELGGAWFYASVHFETGNKGKVGLTPQELFLRLMCLSRQSEEESGQKAWSSRIWLCAKREQNLPPGTSDALSVLFVKSVYKSVKTTCGFTGVLCARLHLG